ncbi:MAG: cyanophycin synthetase, partial [Acidobacteriota bacterium]
RNLIRDGLVTRFDLTHPELPKPERFVLNLPGQHNVLNAMAAIAVAIELGVETAAIQSALSTFSGIDRRLQVLDTVETRAGSVLFVDDYGHHPTEIRAVLSTVRDAWDRRTIVCFQPHRYSRSQMLKDDFGRAFYQADRVLVLPIYAAGEDPIEGVTSEALATSIKEHGHKQVENVAGLAEATETLAAMVRPGDLVLTLGAGDVWKVARDLARRLSGDSALADPDPTTASGNDH